MMTDFDVEDTISDIIHIRDELEVARDELTETTLYFLR